MNTSQFLKRSLALVALVLLFGCQLELQDQFEYKPALTVNDPFDNMTAWEFLTTLGTETTFGRTNNEGFHYMVAAIKKAGLEDLYSQTSTTERTYLLLNNQAFKGSQNVLQIATGTARIPTDETPEEAMERVNTPAKLEKLRKILQYHIVSEYINQVPKLYNYGTWYQFQTLLPGDDGVIAFLRDEAYRIFVNGRRANLNPKYPESPMSAYSQARNDWVRTHNYVFNNGIGHILKQTKRGNSPY